MTTGIELAGSVKRAGRLKARGGDRASTALQKPSGRGWQRWLSYTVVLTDIGVMIAVAAAAVLIGVNQPPRGWAFTAAIENSALAAGLAIAALAIFGAWSPKVLGQGSDEYNRVFRALVVAVLLLAFLGMATKDDSLRPWVFGVLPATCVALLGGRFGIRTQLHRARRDRTCMSRVLVVGRDAAIRDLANRTNRVPEHGWTVVAGCTSTGMPHDGKDTVDGIPVVGDLDDVARCAEQLGVDIIAVAPTPGWSPKRLQRLAWEIEGAGIELVVDPGIMEVSGPRLHVAPVDGLPLLRLTEPSFSGPVRVVKGLFDRLVAVGLLAALAPVLLVLSILIKRDGGPVFYRQERVGLRGRTFRMVKFRSMVVDADQKVAALAATNEASGPLFKMKADPRITSIGKTLRRLSLDELPQLFNVVAGSMSLVGPRPPLAREVATYADDARRKLLVRPGMTGLWQVSGRSDLSWDESVRLDLRYVENWSPMLDVSILWKTVGAVFAGRGAY